MPKSAGFQQMLTRNILDIKLSLVILNLSQTMVHKISEIFTHVMYTSVLHLTIPWSQVNKSSDPGDNTDLPLKLP